MAISQSPSFPLSFGLSGLANVNLADILHPPLHDFTTAQDGVDTIDTDFDASNNHTFVVDFVIEDPQTFPSTAETIFSYGVGSNNYFWVRRNTSGSIEVLLRSLSSTLINLSLKEEMIYINRKMRLGFTLDSSGNYNLYVNGRRFATATGKSEPNTNDSTALYFNKGYQSDLDSDHGTRLRYYNTAKTRAEMELITDVSLSELGLSYSYDSTALGIVGQGQSQMSGAEAVGNKSTMPEVATGRLKLLNVNGDLEDFSESWYDPGAKDPIFRAFAQTFAGGGFTHFAGYMGRIGNDIAAKNTQKVIVTCGAASGTVISTDWAGARTDINSGAGTTEAIGYMTFGLWEAIRQMKAAAGKVILYLDQGQGDALASLSEADYETQLQAMIDWLNYYYPDLEYYIVGFNAYNAASTIVEADWDNIHQARKDIAAANADCVFIDVEDVVITNPDGLHYLNANQEIVGARCADAYTGGDVYELDNPSSGNSEPAALAALDNAEENFIVVRFKPTNTPPSSDEYIVHINRGGSSPATHIRLEDTSGLFVGGYRADSGAGLTNSHPEVPDNNVVSTVGFTNRNRTASAKKVFNAVLDEDTFTTQSFANSDFTDLEVGTRNAGLDSFTGTIEKIVIGNTFLDSLVISKLMKNDNRLVVMAGGQSLARQYWSSTDTSTDAGIEAIISTIRGFDSDLEVIEVDGAEGGSAIDPRSIAGDANSDEYWLDAGNHVAQELKQFLDLIKRYALTDAKVLWDLGITDSHDLDSADNVTLLEFKAKTLVIFNIIRSVGADIEFHIINLGRRTSFGNTGGYQKLRDMYKELAAEYSWIKLCPETYDLALTDQVHNTDAAIAIAAARIGRHFARELGETVTGSVYGPEITAVSRSGTAVTVTIAHDGGTDFTPTSAIQGFIFHDDGSAITINSAVRTDETTITLTLASEPTGVEVLYYGYDAMTEISDTTKIVKDNSSQTLPLKTAKIYL